MDNAADGLTRLTLRVGCWVVFRGLIWVRRRRRPRINTVNAFFFRTVLPPRSSVMLVLSCLILLHMKGFEKLLGR